MASRVDPLRASFDVPRLISRDRWQAAARRLPVKGEWLTLGAIWLASLLTMPSGPGHGGAIDIAFAVNRGILGLVICYLLVPHYLLAGRYLAFVVATVAAIAAFGMLQVHGLGPWLHMLVGGHVGCARCYLTNTLPVVATMAVAKVSWSFAENQRRVAALGQERSESELRFLRSQINPHLLFNTLNNIYAYALERSDRAPAMILKLSGVLRYMLYEVGDRAVLLRRELDYIIDYFDLQRLATEDRGALDLRIEGEPGGLTIAPLVLIVFIENCFKHAVETTGRMFVSVRIRIEGDVLELETVNNVGEPSSQPGGRVGGIGLENVRRRLELLYPGRHALVTGDADGRFRASLRLQLSA